MRKKNRITGCWKKNGLLLKKKSQLGVSYLSVIHYFITLIGSANVRFFFSSWPVNVPVLAAA